MKKQTPPRNVTSGEIKGLMQHFDKTRTHEMTNATRVVREVYDYYLMSRPQAERENRKRRLDRLGDLLWKFGGDKLNPFVFDAAMLGDIWDEMPKESRLRPQIGRRFRDAMRLYFNKTRELYTSGDRAWFSNQTPPEAQITDVDISQNPYANIPDDTPIAEVHAETSPELELTKVVNILDHRAKIRQFQAKFNRTIDSKMHFSKLKYPQSIAQFALSQANTESVDEFEWSNYEQFVSPIEAHKVLEEISMASTLTLAVEAFCDLDSLARKLSDRRTKESDKQKYNNPETFRQVIFAQEFLAPLAENQGFDALAMALGGIAKEIRMTFGTDDDRAYLDLARRIKAELPDDKVMNSAVEDITSRLFGCSVTELIMKNNGEHSDVVYGTGIMQRQLGESDHREVWRAKTDGALAWKLRETAEEKSAKWNAEHPDEPRSFTAADLQSEDYPLDIVAQTVIAFYEQDQQSMFADAAKLALELNESDPNFSLAPSPSRKHAMQVRGTPNFVEEFRQKIFGVGISEPEQQIEFKTGDDKETYADDDVHVAKMTFYYNYDGHRIPIEIQCVTEEYRAAMRTGKISHWLYKAKKKDEANMAEIVSAIKELHARKVRLSSPHTVNVKSAREAWEIKHAIDIFDSVQVGAAATKTQREC